MLKMRAFSFGTTKPSSLAGRCKHAAGNEAQQDLVARNSDQADEPHFESYPVCYSALSSHPSYVLQAVASMLLGLKREEMMTTEDLVAWNSDQADEPRYTWPYPPVLMLGAAQDFYWDKELINSSINFFEHQVSSCRLL